MGLGGPSWSLPAFVDSLPLQPSLPIAEDPQSAVLLAAAPFSAPLQRRMHVQGCSVA